jgi:intermediate filament protein if
VQIERREGVQAANERDREIQELRGRLEELGRDYDELVTTKSSLDAEIAIYRKLLEGEENRYDTQYLYVKSVRRLDHRLERV